MMKLKENPDWLLLGMALIVVLVFSGVLIADKPLIKLCQRDCSANVLLYLLFGDAKGRIVFAVIGVSIACFVAYRALFERQKSESKKNN
jgi:hypothetical protein